MPPLQPIKFSDESLRLPHYILRVPAWTLTDCETKPAETLLAEILQLNPTVPWTALAPRSLHVVYGKLLGKNGTVRERTLLRQMFKHSVNVKKYHALLSSARTTPGFEDFCYAMSIPLSVAANEPAESPLPRSIFETMLDRVLGPVEEDEDEDEEVEESEEEDEESEEEEEKEEADAEEEEVKEVKTEENKDQDSSSELSELPDKEEAEPAQATMSTKPANKKRRRGKAEDSTEDEGSVRSKRTRAPATRGKKATIAQSEEDSGYDVEKPAKGKMTRAARTRSKKAGR